MFIDNKEWHECQLEYLEEEAYDLVASGNYPSFEGFVDRLMTATNAIELLGDRKSVEEYFLALYQDAYSSVGQS